MANLEFADYTATYEDSDGEKQSSTVQAARVTAKEKGQEVNTVAGARVLNTGDVVVQTDNPNVFDVCTSGQWKSTGYERTK